MSFDDLVGALQERVRVVERDLALTRRSSSARLAAIGVTLHRGSLSRNATSRARLPAGPDPAELAGFFTPVVVSATAMTLARPNFPVRAPLLADRLEAWGAAVFFGMFKLLPLDCASAVGGGLARRIGPFLGVSRHARRNIRRAFPELSETEIADLIGGMWSNLGRVAAEYPHLREISVFEPGGRVETHGFEHVDRAVAAGRRMIVFSGHIANWEIGMLAGLQHGISVAQIYRALNNPLMDRMIARFRGDSGEFIPKGAIAARRAIAGLRHGKHLGLLADQKMNDGIPVLFFGRPAMTAPALAVLALRFDCNCGRKTNHWEAKTCESRQMSPVVS